MRRSIRYLPDFRGVHLDRVRVRNLLQHSAGLVQWQPLYYAGHTKEQTYQVIRAMPLQWGVGEERYYSDLRFMLIGYIVERVAGQPLDVFVHERLYDGNSWYANGGVAGLAGLFAPAGELRVLLDMLVNGGSYGGRAYLRPETVSLFLTRDRYDNYLGWVRPASLPAGSFAHTGFTGTYVLGVPAQHLSIALLTNRQNLGTSAQGFFPNLAPLQAAVTQAIVTGDAADGARRPAPR